MPSITDRDTVALHAAGQALLLLDHFNRAGNRPDNLDVEIGEYGGGYISAFFIWPDTPAGFTRSEIIYQVAQLIIYAAAEQAAHRLSAGDRDAAFNTAYKRADALIQESGLNENPERVAREAFDFALRLLKDRKEEFDNLADVFRRRDWLGGLKTIEIAAWTGLAPAIS